MRKTLIPLVVLFVVINALLLVFNNQLDEKGVDSGVVIGGNLLLFLASMLTYFMYHKAMTKKSPHGFVRNVTGTFLIKFLVIITAALCYFYFSSTINKPALIICAGLYLVYTFLGTSQVVKKQQAAKKVVDKKHHH